MEDENKQIENLKKFIGYLREEDELKNIKVVLDIEGSLERYGIDVKWSAMEGFANPSEVRGYITPGESKKGREGIPTIVINGNDSKEEVRYTLAYLLGVLTIHFKYEKGSLISKEDVYVKKSGDKNKLYHLFSVLFLVDDYYLNKLKELYKDEEYGDMVKIISGTFKVKDEHIRELLELENKWGV